MCLIKSEKTCRKGRLTVYKALLKTSKGLITPYMETPVKLGETLRSAIPYSKKVDRYSSIIVGEGVHAYISLERAIKEYKEWSFILGYSPISPVIYEAIIPDVEYWLGTDEDVASVELLITNKKVYPNEE